MTMFNQIVPKFGRQCRPLCLRFGRGLCTKGNKDIPVRAPWRRHDRWGERGLFPSENVFWPFGWRRGRGPFEELEDMSRTMDKMMRRMFSDPFYYGRPSHFAESGARTEVDQVPYAISVEFYFTNVLVKNVSTLALLLFSPCSRDVIFTVSIITALVLTLIRLLSSLAYIYTVPVHRKYRRKE